MKRLAAAFRWIVRWFEDGDLVPLLVVVSAAHYISILSAVDPWFVAVPLGILVDLGHYRAVNIAARYSGNRWTQYAVRWFVATGLTIISGAYHLRYYSGDWALALPVPALIVALAYFKRMERPQPSAHPAQSEPAQRTEPAPSVHTEIGMRDGNGHRAHNCPYCGASFESGQQVAAHVRWRCEGRPAPVAEVQS